MKLESNWRYKSLESLEKQNYGLVPDDESSIISRMRILRKRAINEFSLDDLRFMILQEVGLKYLLTEAISLLEKDLLTEGNYYEGDLLNAVLSIQPENWKMNKENWNKVDELICGQVDTLRQVKPKLNLEKFYAAQPVN
jgi:CDI immunity proteins